MRLVVLELRGRVLFCLWITYCFQGSTEAQEKESGIHITSNLVRVVGGTAWSGYVEFLHDGAWKRHCNDVWGFERARHFCQALGFNQENAQPFPVGEFEGGTFGYTWKLNLICTRRVCEGFLPCASRGDAKVSCYGNTNLQARLVDSSISVNGRIELNLDGEWIPICYEGNMGQGVKMMEKVVCRQLGFNPITARSRTDWHLDPKATTKRWVKDVQCEGKENNVAQCKIKTTEATRCSKDYFLICQGLSESITKARLHEIEPRGGPVSVLRYNKWQAVCPDGWDVREATVLCRTLGFFKSLNKPRLFTKDQTPSKIMWSSFLTCLGIESQPNECKRIRRVHDDGSSFCESDLVAGVNCGEMKATPIRLSNNQLASGTVEIEHDNQWGFVCNIGSSINVAKVVCKMLGFSPFLASLTDSATSIRGRPKYWLGDLECTGVEDDLQQCIHKGWGATVCPSGGAPLTVSCVVDGNWGEWGPFSLCTLSCGGGTQFRTRQCNNPAPSAMGSPCRGPSTESASCNTRICPVHGNWGGWSFWTECSETCDGGERHMTRSCDSPAPAFGGDPCEGPDVIVEECNTGTCPDLCPPDMRLMNYVKTQSRNTRGDGWTCACKIQCHEHYRKFYVLIRGKEGDKGIRGEMDGHARVRYNAMNIAGKEGDKGIRGEMDGHARVRYNAMNIAGKEGDKGIRGEMDGHARVRYNAMNIAGKEGDKGIRGEMDGHARVRYNARNIARWMEVGVLGEVTANVPESVARVT
ncbi:unnamed protein product [Owenia fusiformis]|uniref:SRCR domain-containing protein n=1 Tax=Owenia fusiformis TaxID=6347 RepID=A0A8S4NQ02_OWEFU|nr:unnamed protein product [Owenia fusiformis]